MFRNCILIWLTAVQVLENVHLSLSEFATSSEEAALEDLGYDYSGTSEKPAPGPPEGAREKLPEVNPAAQNQTLKVPVIAPFLNAETDAHYQDVDDVPSSGNLASRIQQYFPVPQVSDNTVNQRSSFDVPNPMLIENVLPGSQPYLQQVPDSPLNQRSAFGEPMFVENGVPGGQQYPLLQQVPDSTLNQRFEVPGSMVEQNIVPGSQPYPQSVPGSTLDQRSAFGEPSMFVNENVVPGIQPYPSPQQGPDNNQPYLQVQQVPDSNLNERSAFGFSWSKVVENGVPLEDKTSYYYSPDSNVVPPEFAPSDTAFNAVPGQDFSSGSSFLDENLDEYLDPSDYNNFAESAGMPAPDPPSNVDTNGMVTFAPFDFFKFPPITFKPMTFPPFPSFPITFPPSMDFGIPNLENNG